MSVIFSFFVLVQILVAKKKDWCVSLAVVDSLNKDWVNRKSGTYYIEQGKGTRVLFYDYLNSNISNITDKTWSFRNSTIDNSCILYCSIWENVTQISSNPNYCQVWIGDDLNDTNITFRKCNAKKNDHNYDFLLEKSSSSSLVVSSMVSGSIFFLWLVFIIFGKCKNDYYEASTLDTYSKILEKKGHQPSEKPQNMEKSLGELVLRDDLKNEKIIWSNHFGLDFLFYVKINHALISVFVGHPNHTYSTTTRFIIMLVILAGNMSITAFTLAVISDEPKNERETFNTIFGIFFGIIMFIFEKIISFVGTKCQLNDKRDSCLQCCCEAMRCFWFTVVYVAVGCWFVIALVAFGISETTTKIWGHMIWTFAVSSFQSWFIIGLFLAFLNFWVFWQTYHPLNNPRDKYEVEKMHLFGKELPFVCNRRCTDVFSPFFKLIAKISCGLLFKEEIFKIEDLDGSDKFIISHHDYIAYTKDDLEPNGDEEDLLAKFAGQNLKQDIVIGISQIKSKPSNKNTETQSLDA